MQLLWNATPDLSILHSLCIRTFDWRRQQSWPPLPVRPMDGWALAYAEAREETEISGETPVLPDIVAARDWLARIIEAVADTDT